MNFIINRKPYTNTRIYIVFFALFLCLAHAPFQASAGNGGTKNETQAFDSSIILFAPTSMTNAMHEIIRSFSRAENVSVSSNFESSAEISRLILEGEPANIYITDDSTQMRDLQRLGVLNVFSVANIVSDKLVLAVPKNNFLEKKLANMAEIEEKLKFIAKNVSMVIPDPDSDPAGKAAKQAFEKIGIWDQVSKKMLRAANTRNALYLIYNGNSPGIIYNSDAASEPDVTVLITIPDEYYDKITYQASIVAEIGKEATRTDSEKFMDFLKSEETRDIFTRYGFQIP